MRLRRLPALLLAGAMTVFSAGCAGTDPDIAPTQDETSTTTAALPDPVMGAAYLDDATGDGANADIRHVVLALGDAGLTLTYELVEAPPDAGTFLLAVTVFSEDGNTGRQLGAKWIAGEPKPAVFIFDFDTAMQENVNVAPTVTGTTISVTYPASAVAGLGESFTWYAASNVDGNDADRAPDAQPAAFLPS